MKSLTQRLRFAPHTYANVGSFDRLARVGLASVLIGITLTANEPMGANVLMTLVAIPLVISAMMAWDPLYAALGIRTATLHARPRGHWTPSPESANAGINVGTADRLGRVGLAAALLSVTLLSSGPIEYAVFAALLSIPVTMTAVVGWDPLYAVAGIRTATLPIETAQPYALDRPVEVFKLFDEDEQGQLGRARNAA